MNIRKETDYKNETTALTCNKLEHGSKFFPHPLPPDAVRVAESEGLEKAVLNQQWHLCHVNSAHNSGTIVNK